MNRIRRVLPLLAVAAVFFCYGFISGKFQVFPYDLIRKAVPGEDQAAEPGPSALPPMDWDRQISQEKSWVAAHLETLEAEAPSVRAALVDRLILPASQVTLAERPLDPMMLPGPVEAIAQNARLITARYYGITVRGVLEPATGAVRGLYIHHQGHGGNPQAFDYFRDLKTRLRAQGYDVLSLSMIGIGYNIGPAQFPIGIGERTIPYALTAKDAQRHSAYSFFSDPAQPQAEPLSLFLSGSYHIIRSVLQSYDTVVMGGISGGGWSTSILSALIPEIEHSFAVAGSLPLVYRVPWPADWEFTSADIWRDYDYYTFYLLGLFDADGKLNRGVDLIYNRFDPCCAKPPQSDFLKSTLDSLGLPALRTDIINHDTHTINVDYLTGRLQEAGFLAAP